MHRSQIFLVVLMSVIFAASLGTQCLGQRSGLIILTKDRDGKQQLAAVGKRYRQAVEFRLNSRINEIDKVCSLSAGQKAKFKIATKGAIQRFIDNKFEKVAERTQQVYDKTNWDKLGANAPFAVPYTLTAVDQVEATPFWKKSQLQILTKQQNTTLQTHDNNRRQATRKVAIDHFMKRLDASLFLTEKQTAALRKIITDNFGNEIVASVKLTFEWGPTLPHGARVRKYEVLVSEILTEDQLVVWKEEVIPVLFRLKNSRKEN